MLLEEFEFSRRAFLGGQVTNPAEVEPKGFRQTTEEESSSDF
jgi:hypothetical protein